MTSKSPVIVGAGLAGLIAAHAWPNAPVIEAMPEPRANHRAVLRFRTDAVARLTGIDFRRVRVRKGIWHDDAFRSPDIRLANLYSRKVLGHLGAERSIWNIEPVDRYVAPDSLYEQLLGSVRDRVQWGRAMNYLGCNLPIVSTAPLPDVLAAMGPGYKTQLAFERAPITVARFSASSRDLYQTVYFPGEETSMYRASITGDTLILEFAGDATTDGEVMFGAEIAAHVFDLRLNQTSANDKASQRYGKISPVDDAARKALLFRLTHEHRVFSLGRFATWRNILLDDVVDDIGSIKRLMRYGSYDQHKEIR